LLQGESVEEIHTNSFLKESRFFQLFFLSLSELVVSQQILSLVIFFHSRSGR